MSKRRHKHKEYNNGNINNGMNGINNNPFGINPMQLMNMMGNVDMSEINRIISTMNSEGFDFNNINLNSIQNLLNRNMNGVNVNPINNQPVNNINVNKENNEESKKLENNDDNIEMLMNLRNIVDGNRVVFIDKIIELYKKGVFND